MSVRILCFLLLFFAAGFAPTAAVAQLQTVCTIKNNRLYVQVPRGLPAAALDSFLVQFELADLGLKTFLKTGAADSLTKRGWRVEANNEVAIVITKQLEPFDGLDDLDDRLFSKDREPVFPAVNNGVVLGVNKFRNKASFYRGDSLVRFFLRGRTGAQRVFLAGSFNRWRPDELLMQKTDSGWIYETKLGPGKYWYKFVADGDWLVDRDNQLSENDGRGNVNSVFFRPNANFTLQGSSNAKKVALAGSFNNWKPAEIFLERSPNGWRLPVYLAEGTYTYRFVVDGQGLADAANLETVPDGQGGVNSVLRLGRTQWFRLDGFQNAKRVLLAGSFNQWREFEWEMKKTARGWELPFQLGPGNYAYKFFVDGKGISDPASALTSPETGNSYLIVEPNYTFRLKGKGQASRVFLAGDFNNWDPAAYAMKREGGDWVFLVHLAAGKHLYKFVVDGEWITDPANKLWEQNRYGTGNSVLWTEE